MEDVEVLESIQRKATKLVKKLKRMSCEEQIRTLGLSRLEERRLRDGLIVLCSLRRWREEGGSEVFSLLSSDRLRGYGTKYASGGLDWTRGISLLRGWSNHGEGFLQKW